MIGKIAVDGATYYIDRAYDYLIPEQFADELRAGMRVYVPFGNGNVRREGIVLAITDQSEYKQLKSILAVLDKTPILTEEQLRLALFMRERFFCTVYDAVKAMLPAGLWFNDEGKQRVNDKTIEMAHLLITTEEAMELSVQKRKRSAAQGSILELLCSFDTLPTGEITRFTGASKQSLKALAKAGIIELYRRETYRRPDVYVGEPMPLPVLNEEQTLAYKGLSALATSGKSCAALLQGVTGSGKTSVYIHLIRQQLENGRSAILLVPEIALTPQMLQTFSSHFGDEIAVLHSSLSSGERYDEWKRIKQGKAHVVIGTRSAVFAPVDNLGLLIIDEEQEETYKSENSPRYDAREVAKFRCVKFNCMLLLGSATPDVVSRYNAQIGKYSYFRLNTRYNEMQLPKVEIVDMKKELKAGNSGNVSSFLRDELQSNIDKGEQSILFLNRRGTNKLITCGECGFTYKCPRCSVSLTYHSNNNRLMCHYCGYSKRLENACPQCGGQLNHIGAGTQAIVEELNGLFPGIEVMRMDTDSVAPVGSHEQLFSKFRKEKIPIMVGTQMVTKGLNFENVTLVGVISADQSLNAGDYRASERCFSLITQVIGRSGRGSKPGRAIIQTFTPANETIVQASNQDYDLFYDSEIQMRRQLELPPFTKLFSVTASGTDEQRVINACRYIKSYFDNVLKGRGDCAALGPTPLSVVKVNNTFRYRINISCRDEREMRKLISGIVIECNKNKNFRGVSVYAENNPSN